MQQGIFFPELFVHERVKRTAVIISFMTLISDISYFNITIFEIVLTKQRQIIFTILVLMILLGGDTDTYHML